MIVKLDITLTDGEVVDHLDGKAEAEVGKGFDLADKATKSLLVSEVLESVGLSDANGGWTVKVSEPKAGGVRITATLVPTGAVVLG